MKQLFEVEIKSLLGAKSKADELVEKLKSKGTNVKKLHSNKQLNHYFIGGNFLKLKQQLQNHLKEDQIQQLQHIIDHGRNHSVRTREVDSRGCILVIKASADETTSSNGTARLEFEIAFNDLSLSTLDQILLESEFQYQAKWSRERQEYQYKDMIVCIDKNAGYGYLAEFERVVGEDEDLEKVKANIRKEMRELSVEELPQDRLARMFDFYNKNWSDYYGTEKTFTIK